MFYDSDPYFHLDVLVLFVAVAIMCSRELFQSHYNKSPIILIAYTIYSISVSLLTLFSVSLIAHTDLPSVPLF